MTLHMEIALKSVTFVIGLIFGVEGGGVKD